MWSAACLFFELLTGDYLFDVSLSQRAARSTVLMGALQCSHNLGPSTTRTTTISRKFLSCSATCQRVLP